MRCDANVESPVLRSWSDTPFYVQSAGSTDDPPEAARHEVLRPRSVNEIAADVPIAPPPALRRNANEIAPDVPIAPPPEPTAPPLEKTASPPKWPPVPRGCIGHVRLSSQAKWVIVNYPGVHPENSWGPEPPYFLEHALYIRILRMLELI